jgi:3'-phosphoadenosine 5'-phosphosulfate sulfotransferase (PAPS reductase)/FAD synthetase
MKTLPEIKIELCRFKLSPECMVMGPKNQFEGRCCNVCKAMRLHRYYLEHREHLIASNIASQRRRKEAQKLQTPKFSIKSSQLRIENLISEKQI